MVFEHGYQVVHSKDIHEGPMSPPRPTFVSPKRPVPKSAMLKSTPEAERVGESSAGRGSGVPTADVDIEVVAQQE